MLYVIENNNTRLLYEGGQRSVIHLEAKLHRTVEWVDSRSHRWAFTYGDADSYNFNSWRHLSRLGCTKWRLVYMSCNEMKQQSGLDDYWKRHKQSEFLLECYFLWFLVERIGVMDSDIKRRVDQILDEHPEASRHS